MYVMMYMLLETIVHSATKDGPFVHASRSNSAKAQRATYTSVFVLRRHNSAYISIRTRTRTHVCHVLLAVQEYKNTCIVV